MAGVAVKHRRFVGNLVLQRTIRKAAKKLHNVRKMPRQKHERSARRFLTRQSRRTNRLQAELCKHDDRNLMEP